jgi:hypothetical protein
MRCENGPRLWSSGESSWLQNGDVLRFLWGTNWIYLCYVGEIRPPLWSSGHGYRSKGPGSIPGATRFFSVVVDLERDSLSLVSTVKELLGRKSSGFCLETLEYERRYPSRWPRSNLYLQKLALTSPTSGSCSVRIVCSRTQARVFRLSFLVVKTCGGGEI